MSKQKSSYKNPTLLFTSGALRYAAWAGWYSALGEKKLTEDWEHYAMAEYTKEIAAVRGYSFLKQDNREIMTYIPSSTLKKLLDDFLKEIKKEVKKGKAYSIKKTSLKAM
jgi:hypothetical protein